MIWIDGIDDDAATDASGELTAVALDATGELAAEDVDGEAAAEALLLPVEPEDPDDEPPPIPFTAAQVPEKPMPGVAPALGVLVTSGPGSGYWTS